MSADKYFADGLSVFKRTGNNPVIEREVVGTLVSKRFAKIVANCLNLYARSDYSIKQRLSADADEKEENNNGNRNRGTTESSNSQSTDTR